MDDYLNFTQVCRALDINPRTLIRRMARDGVVPLLGPDRREKLIRSADLPSLRSKRGHRAAIQYPVDVRE